MKLLWCLWLATAGFAVCALAAPPVNVGGARVSKVLLHYIDQRGRYTLSPSLYERDAYQNFLRQNPTNISALRFEVRWQPPGGAGPTFRLRMEVRGEKTGGTPIVIEAPVEPVSRSGGWSSVLMDRATLEKCGAVIAWRARLYHGDGLAAEMQSFLW